MMTAHITMTGKSYSPRDKWQCYDECRLSAATLPELKTLLADRYGPAWKRKQAMFCDKKDGSTVQTGWVVGFRNADYSHAPVQKWLQQDWITIAESRPVEWGAKL